MGQLSECTENLVRAIRCSGDYVRYTEAEKELQKEPELKKQVDEYRLRVFRLQESRQDLYEHSDYLQKEYESLLRNPLAAEYLDAESAVCRLLQRIVWKISEGAAVELPR